MRSRLHSTSVAVLLYCYTITGDDAKAVVVCLLHVLLNYVDTYSLDRWCIGKRAKL